MLSIKMYLSLISFELFRYTTFYLALRKYFGLLVLLGYDVTAFTPAAYQGHSL